MEVLSRMMVAVVIEVFISGFSVGARNEDTLFVSYLLFCGVTPDSLRYLICVFPCFEAISRLKIISAKSELLPIGCLPNRMPWLVS